MKRSAEIDTEVALQYAAALAGQREEDHYTALQCAVERIRSAEARCVPDCQSRPEWPRGWREKVADRLEEISRKEWGA